VSRRGRRGALSFWLIFCAPLVAGRAALPARRPAVEIKVEVTEVDNVKASRLGVEWLDTVAFEEAAPAGIVAVGPVERLTNLHADLHLLVEEGAAELLANPNLVTDSGTTAVFHAGGQMPYITSTSLGSSNVQFKSYGVALEVSPRVTKERMIQMKIRASVSAPDPANSVALSGNSVPAIMVRDVSSNVTVRPGATITLAGLVQTQTENRQSGVPILRRIPLLGWFFRWHIRSHRRTTVIMFVTPRLAEL